MKKLWLGGRKLTQRDVEAVGGSWEDTMKSDKDKLWWYINSSDTWLDLWGGRSIGVEPKKEYAQIEFNSKSMTEINTSLLTKDPRRLP